MYLPEMVPLKQGCKEVRRCMGCWVCGGYYGNRWMMGKADTEKMKLYVPPFVVWRTYEGLAYVLGGWVLKMYYLS